MYGPTDLAKHYFALSNFARLDDIEQLFSDSSTYSSMHTGIYRGSDLSMQTQRNFYARFESLRWYMHAIQEVRNKSST